MRYLLLVVAWQLQAAEPLKFTVKLETVMKHYVFVKRGEMR